jgi:hypothetical protein
LEELLLLDVLLEELEEFEVELELVVDGVEVAVPGMVAALMAPKSPTAATPPAAVQTVRRRSPRSPLSRVDRWSPDCGPICMVSRLPVHTELALRPG